MLDHKVWIPIDNNSTGYVGARRNEEWAKRDKLYGKGNWKIGWFVGSKILDYEEACKMYEDAYFEYFKKRPELLEHLIEVAADVYDDNPGNVKAGFHYTPLKNRGQVRTHIQDTAIRNSVKRFGRKFQGKKLIQIRDRVGSHPLSLALSPGQVQFHQPELLSNPDNLAKLNPGWWLPGSVEDWYQRAKRLCVKKNISTKPKT